MDKTEICKRIKQVKTIEEFAELLDVIRQEEFGVTKNKITKKKLLYFCSSKYVYNRYKTFEIKKKSGGTRVINAPCYQLGLLLYLVNIIFKSIYTPDLSVNGFVEGRSIIDNAQLHVGHHYVFNIDLKDFFPSISQSRVWKRIQLPPFNFTRDVANVIAGLCCNFDSERQKNVLPQGAATSPILSNAICENLDRKMCGVARRLGLHYSRYADDITFSSMHNVYQPNSEFRLEIERIINEQGFVLNDKKTRLLRDRCRQEVTGLVVNRVLNVSREYVNGLRSILYIWKTQGYAKAYSIFYRKYKEEKSYVKKGEPVMENVIEGKLNFLCMVKGKNNVAYQKLQRRFEKLMEWKEASNNNYSVRGYAFINIYEICEFEKLFDTKISLLRSSRGNLVGECALYGVKKILSIEKTTQKWLCEKGVKCFDELLCRCYISLCRNRGKNFWLITMNLPRK